MTTTIKKRPKHLDLSKIRLPVPGLVSILHRISGAILFLVFIPLLLFALATSLASAESFSALQAKMAHPLSKILLLGFAWSYLHHFCAGIRHLLLDLHKGTDLPTARLSAKIVMVVSLVFTLLIGIRLW
ncbi:MAG: succinate dehydrogenase, cytochrome b556 subunit [Burkholderiales bacterium]